MCTPTMRCHTSDNIFSSLCVSASDSSLCAPLFVPFSSFAMDARVYNSLSDQVRCQATINTVPRAFTSQLLPYNYRPIMLLSTAYQNERITANPSASSSSSTLVLNLDNEINCFADTLPSDKPPRCYDDPATRAVVFRPYARPRVFKKYPGKRKPC
mgnify:CR=1 FL=1